MKIVVAIVMFVVLAFVLWRVLSSSVYSYEREVLTETKFYVAALDQYKVDHGEYPDSQIGFQVIEQYLEAPVRVLFRDPWEHDLIYIAPLANSTKDIRLYSVGPDGIDDKGLNDDIEFRR